MVQLRKVGSSNVMVRITSRDEMKPLYDPMSRLDYAESSRRPDL